MELKDNLRSLIKEKSITREKFAQDLGVSYWTVVKYLSGERTPDYETLGKISDYFNISIDQLLGRDETIEIDETKLNPRAVKFMLRAEEKLSKDKYDELLDWAERMAKMLEEEDENE